ncbi:MAG: Cof-type HAD-IIB family hydrolase [Lachnospiraceae bacterium]|nr:Cof-type HAD-IIB family hydrolase [Lachnospiraceae bacterium]
MKILLTDLDDTLLNSDKTISAGNRQAIDDLLEAGHYFSICTGRSLTGGMVVAKELQLNRKNCFLIAYQGCVIYDLYQQKTINEQFLNPHHAIELMSMFRELQIHTHSYRRGELLVFEDDKELQRYRSITKDAFVTVPNMEYLQDQNMYKVIAIDFDQPERLHQFVSDHKDFLNQNFNYFFSSPYYLEFVAKDCGKGVGALNLADYLGVAHSDVIACGDEQNDISMIQAAGIGVCMQNGRPEVKAVADYITTLDNNHDGIAEVIHKFVL